MCQQYKVENEHPGGLLEPLPVPELVKCLRVFFISAFPKYEGDESFMVILDRFSKYRAFHPSIYGLYSGRSVEVILQARESNFGDYHGALLVTETHSSRESCERNS